MSPDLTLIHQRIGRSSKTFPPTSKLSGSWEIDRTVHKTIAIYRSGMGSQIDSLLPCSIFLTNSQRFRFQKMAKSLTYLIWCPMWVNYLIINYVCPARPVLSSVLSTYKTINKLNQTLLPSISLYINKR